MSSAAAWAALQSIASGLALGMVPRGPASRPKRISCACRSSYTVRISC